METIFGRFQFCPEYVPRVCGCRIVLYWFALASTIGREVSKRFRSSMVFDFAKESRVVWFSDVAYLSFVCAFFTEGTIADLKKQNKGTGKIFDTGRYKGWNVENARRKRKSFITFALPPYRELQ
jgi:hypothetical protein